MLSGWQAGWLPLVFEPSGIKRVNGYSETLTMSPEGGFWSLYRCTPKRVERTPAGSSLANQVLNKWQVKNFLCPWELALSREESEAKVKSHNFL